LLPENTAQCKRRQRLVGIMTMADRPVRDGRGLIACRLEQLVQAATRSNQRNRGDPFSSLLLSISM